MNDYADYLKVVKILFQKRITVFKITFLFFCIGIITALIVKDKYTSTSSFIPQSQSEISSSFSSFSGIASLAGLNVPQMEDSEIPPKLYPEIIYSVPFNIELLNSNIIHNGNDLTYRDYLLKNKGNFNFLKKIVDFINGYKSNETIENDSYIYEITNEENTLLKRLRDLIIINVNKKDGIVHLSVVDNDKYISSKIAEKAQIILQKKIISYKVKRSQEILDYTNSQYEIKRNEYNILQDEIASFKDKNVNISSALFQNTIERLNDELNILKNVTQQLAAQVEQAKLQVNKNTPVFTIINPVTIPYEKSNFSRKYILLLITSFGLIISIIFILYSNKIKEFIELIKN